jgi:hypothetical protein
MLRFAGRDRYEVINAVDPEGAFGADTVGIVNSWRSAPSGDDVVML